MCMHANVLLPPAILSPALPLHAYIYMNVNKRTRANTPCPADQCRTRRGLGYGERIAVSEDAVTLQPHSWPQVAHSCLQSSSLMTANLSIKLPRKYGVQQK